MMQEKESGRILQCIGGIYTVATDSGTISCKARGVFRKRGMTPYAGDFVTVEQGVMTEILPRKNSIIRPPLANLDQLLFVTSTYKPVPNLLLLDQFMAVAIYKQIQPVLVLTKLDLQDGAALQKLYTNAGIPVYPVCYDQPDTLEAVRACLRGKVSALTGNWDVDGIRPDKLLCIRWMAVILQIRPDFLRLNRNNMHAFPRKN